MTRTALLSIPALVLALATSTRAQTAKPNPFLAVLYQLSQSVEAIADDAGRVCRLDLTSLPQVGRNLSKLKKLEADLSELRKRYGARADFPAAEARRIGGRIESLEASLVRLKGATHLVQARGVPEEDRSVRDRPAAPGEFRLHPELHGNRRNRRRPPRRDSEPEREPHERRGFGRRD